MLKIWHPLLTSAHARMVLMPFYIFPGIICVGGDGIINEVCYLLLQWNVVSPLIMS
ncbi:hypothetical protein Pint_21926 [Pistacia integerrima]|uniref:Uncharacterized protein n=1 Tax=Pistacia integerrima TaxID=434235 RepID=A0ACC0YLV6_9ROSI|nr:hypothetical protein Pint_21926 [Pistacia integerrima]